MSINRIVGGTSTAAGGGGGGAVYSPVTMTAVSGTITPNAALGYGPHRYTATSNVTLAEPVGGVDGQPLEVQVFASGGDRVLTVAGTAVTIPAGAYWWGHYSYNAARTTWILDDAGGGGGTGTTDPEVVRDTIAAALVAGSNVTITPNDAGDTITIAAATTGSSGIPATIVDVKGDLIAATAADTVARLAVGTNGQVLRANSATTTGLEYATLAVADITGLQAALDALTASDKAITANTQTGTAYTLVLADAGKTVELNNAAANTLTIPPNSTVAFPVGTVVEVFQLGAGQTTVAAGAGVTLRAPDGAKLAKQYASASLRKRGTDEWVIAGSVTV